MVFLVMSHGQEVLWVLSQMSTYSQIKEMSDFSYPTAVLSQQLPFPFPLANSQTDLVTRLELNQVIRKVLICHSL
jgi:hypothetical protein